jgi:hypothetical protein
MPLLRPLVQTKGLDFRSSFKNGRARSARLEIYQLSPQASRELLHLLDAGFSGLASIPRHETKDFACSDPEHALARVQLGAG